MKTSDYWYVRESRGKDAIGLLRSVQFKTL